MRVTRSALVERPYADVRQQILHEIEASNAQLPQLDGKVGPLGRGWACHWTLPLAWPRRLDADLEITDWRPPERVGLRFGNSFLAGSFTCAVQPADGRTRIGGELQVYLRGLWRLAEPLASRLLRREFERWADETIADAAARPEGRPPPPRAPRASERLRQERREFRARGPRDVLFAIEMTLGGIGCLLSLLWLWLVQGCRGAQCGPGEAGMLAFGLALLAVGLWGPLEFVVLRPRLLVDEHGITDLTRRVGVGLIPWEAMLSVTPERERVLIWLRDGGAPASRGSKVFRGVVRRASAGEAVWLDLSWTGLSAGANGVWICAKARAHGVHIRRRGSLALW